MGKQTIAKIAAIYAGLVFGIYWIPLREMENGGLDGLWAVALFNLAALLLVLPLIVHRWGVLITGRFRFHLCGFVTGLSFTLYAGAFLYTDVIRVIVLFYLMPVWGFLFARVVIGEKITGARWVSMALGMGGLVVICGVENGIPLPRNAGDWMALLGGVLWAAASLMLLTDRRDPLDYALGFLFWSAVLGVFGSMMLTVSGTAALPSWSAVDDMAVWLIPFVLIVVVPASYAVVFGPSHLNPGVVGLLFMTEISVATLTAALLRWEGPNTTA